ncbi:MAG: phosphatase [Candidatus Dadabacteria bacterium]|nr:phosphatase [Candidatus Dadabacteria bacterium]NIS10219.1 phosphatase [Candidatus Dadabacteria bacterium]NIV42664.1 phosphatase [Candidatus Dadabacteria bacterium]NIX16587.1 phosphatase [Candidatus Dadabacteria bacterium]NIY23134.1 phosphatase [Candidatus Dadabacteria bacterium]
MLKKIKAFNAYLLFYPTLLWTVFLSRVLNLRNWWDEIDEFIILGAIPFSSDVRALHETGVRGIINLCVESSGPTALYKKYDIDYHYLPTVDFTCPDVQTIAKGVSIIRKYRDKDEKVYIHCKAGRGRSATIVFCWLVCQGNYSMEDAMKLLLSKRHQVNRKLHQREQVREYVTLNSN